MSKDFERIIELADTMAAAASELSMMSYQILIQSRKDLLELLTSLPHNKSDVE